MINHKFHLFSNKKKNEDPLTKPSICSIIGPTGSGKSTYLLNYLMALQDKVDFKHALFVSANKKDVILEHIADMKITADPDDINDFVDKISMMTREENHEQPSIIVFDDVQDSPLINIKNNKKLNSFILSHRHHNCWIAFALQSYKNSLNSTLRKMNSMIFMFPPRNKQEEDIMIKEQNVDGNKLKHAFEIARSEEHVPVYINTQSKKAKLFLGFDRELDL